MGTGIKTSIQFWKKMMGVNVNGRGKLIKRDWEKGGEKNGSDYPRKQGKKECLDLKNKNVKCQRNKSMEPGN